MAGQAAQKNGERQGDFVGGKYLLEECLGIGGMGEVYRATNVSLGRKVAIKLLNKEHTSNEDDVLRFLREARAAAAVRHPNVVDVFDVARDDDGTPFIVQELLSGEDLEQYLGASRDGKIGAAEALEIMVPVAEAVAAAHARDVVHRDLKPANIFLAREGNKIIPKVLDFGACLYQTVGVLSAKERRMLIGTPHYMAPEQITTAMDVDARADVWAMGVILYEMLVGETPFEAEDANAVLKLVRTRAVSSLRKVAPDAPASLEELVQRCLDRDRKKRFATVVTLRDELDRIRDELGGRPMRHRIDTLPAPAEELPPDRSEAEASARHRLPSLVLKGGKPTKRRGSSLLNLSSPVDDLAFDVPPHSAPRPVEVAKPAPVGAKPARTAADVIREADEASGIKNKAISSPPLSGSLPPLVSVSSAPASITGLSRPQTPREIDIHDDGHGTLDLDLSPASSRHGDSRPAPISSLPPVLDPRSAGGNGRANRGSDRPPPLSVEGPETPRISQVQSRDSQVQSHDPRELSALTPGLGGPVSVRLPRPSLSSIATSSAPKVEWSRAANAKFGLTIVGPALLAFIVLHLAPFITAPLGHAMRGDTPLASGVLAVLALVGAAALATRALGASRSNAMIVATAGAVLFGMVMIIVTFSASETPELDAPRAAAGIVPFLAPIVPLALGYLALLRAREAWQSSDDRERTRFVVLTSLLLFTALALGPFGVVLRGATPAVAATPAAHAPHPP